MNIIPIWAFLRRVEKAPTNYEPREWTASVWLEWLNRLFQNGPFDKLIVTQQVRSYYFVKQRWYVFSNMMRILRKEKSSNQRLVTMSGGKWNLLQFYFFSCLFSRYLTIFHKPSLAWDGATRLARRGTLAWDYGSHKSQRVEEKLCVEYETRDGESWDTEMPHSRQRRIIHLSPVEFLTFHK